LRLRTAVDTVVHVPFRVVEVEARSVNRHADLHVHTTPAVRPEPVSAKSVCPEPILAKVSGGVHPS
jgi:hypothetical protein